MIRSHADTDIPEGPPPEVLEEIDAAWERSRALFEGGFALRFAIDTGSGRVVADGGFGADTVRFSATEAIGLACGETVEKLLGERAHAHSPA